MDKNQVKGRLKQVKGKIKETTGRLLGDGELELEGQIDHAKGSVQTAFGDLKSDLKKALD